jgi:hypothetical protein
MAVSVDNIIFLSNKEAKLMFLSGLASYSIYDFDIVLWLDVFYRQAPKSRPISGIPAYHCINLSRPGRPATHNSARKVPNDSRWRRSIFLKVPTSTRRSENISEKVPNRARRRKSRLEKAPTSGLWLKNIYEKTPIVNIGKKADLRKRQRVVFG